MKRSLFILILIGLTVTGAAVNAGAYTLITTSSGLSPFWEAPTIPFWINVAGSPQITNGSDLAAVQAAFQTWANIPTATIPFQYMGTTSVSTVAEDGVNLVTFVDSSVPMGSDTVAATFSFFNYDAAGNLVIVESDIALNPSVQFSTSGDPTKYDLQGVVTKEVGHFIGLDDSGLVSSVMAPYCALGQVAQRTLTFDDMAGASYLYGNSSAVSTLAGLEGEVTLSGNGISGAHVVAVDSNGTPVASTIALFGVYFILVPPGSYRIYAEPLDGPLYEDLIGGNPSSAYYELPTDFTTTYYGNSTSLTSAKTATVTAGNSAEFDITLQLSSATGPNITEPNTFSSRISTGASQSITFGGANLASGVSFSTSNSSVTLGAPAFGGGIASDAPTSATMTVSVAAGTALGPKNIMATSGGVSSVLSGGIVVVNPEPTVGQVSPATGPTDGGTNVTISGTNFQTSPLVYFEGVPATNVQWVSASTIQATTPVNVPGGANVMVVNGDGTWGVAASAFSYAAAAPKITSVSPTSGPVGTVITIQGSEFDSRPANLTVTVNGATAMILTASRTSVTAEVPFGATSGAVDITALGGTATGPAFSVTATPTSTNTSAFISFINASSAGGGTVLSFNNTDEASALVTLPFSFTLFNKIYPAGTQVAVCINGWMSLDSFTRPEYQPTTLPATTVQHSDGSINPFPSALIAPLFEDLILRSGSAVSYRTVGSAPNRQLAVEWSSMGILNAQGADTGGTISFEAVLFEGSNDIEFLYQNGSGPYSNGSAALIGIQDSTETQAVQSSYGESVLTTGSLVFYSFAGGGYSGGFNQLPFTVANMGGTSSITSGSGANVTIGYVNIQPSSGQTTPSGVAIFGFRQNGVLVTEAGVPASPSIKQGLLYAEVTGAVGTTNTVDTGVAIVNPNSQSATITFNFVNSSGGSFGSGTTTIPANGKVTAFLDQSPFNGGESIEGAWVFTSTQPVSLIALRTFTNEQGQTLYSTLPVIDTTATIPTTPAVLSRFADGGGWTTQVLLMNPGTTTMTGTVQFFGSSGQVSTITANGTTANSFSFSVPAKTSFKFTTSGTPSTTTVGSVIVTPASGSGTPTSLAVFSYKPAGVTVTQTGVPAISGNAFNVYVEMSGAPPAVGSIDSGVAVANPTSSTATVTFDLTNLSGASVASATTTIPANGEIGEFIDQIFAGSSLTPPFKGVLNITSSTQGLSVVGLRGRYNEVGNFLISTTPPTNAATPASATPLYFPQVADGGGYTTQFILFSGSSGQTSTGLLTFVTPAGVSLYLGFQ